MRDQPFYAQPHDHATSAAVGEHLRAVRKGGRQLDCELLKRTRDPYIVFTWRSIPQW
jgi:hypothetical protein